METKVLLEKLTELAAQNEKTTLLDIDLMMDYTRMLYADLMERRSHLLSGAATSNDDNLKEPVIPSPYQSPAATKIVTPLQAIGNNPAGERGDIRSKIGINDKYQFMSELFGNNKDAYNEVLDELNTFDTYDEAKNWLRSYVADQYNWDEESLTTQLFYSTLSQFFEAM